MRLAQPVIASALATVLCVGGFAAAQGAHRGVVRSGARAALAEGADVTTGSVTHNWTVHGDRTSVEQLRVTGISPANATVTVLCHGRGCPFRKRAFKPSGGTANLVSAFRGHVLRSGANVAVLVVAPGTTGRYVSFDTRRGAVPMLKAACSAPGAISPIGCPGPMGPEGPKGDPGVRGPSGDPGLTGPSDAYVGANGHETLQDPPATTTMETLANLPAGSWLLVMTGNTTCGCSTNIDVVCQIDVNGTVISTSEVRVGTSAGGAAWQNYSSTAWTTQASPSTVHAKCFQGASTPQHPAMDGHLVAIKVGTLNTQNR
jgi:hypothetical protein